MKGRCDNCGQLADDLHEVNMTTDNEIEEYCTDCYDEWCGAKPSNMPRERVVFT